MAQIGHYHVAVTERVLEVDFVGKKYLKGRTKPLNFIAFSFKKESRLRYFKQIKGPKLIISQNSVGISLKGLKSLIWPRLIIVWRCS